MPNGKLYCFIKKRVLGGWAIETHLNLLVSMERTLQFTRISCWTLVHSITKKKNSPHTACRNSAPFKKICQFRRAIPFFARQSTYKHFPVTHVRHVIFNFHIKSSPSPTAFILWSLMASHFHLCRWKSCSTSLCVLLFSGSVATSFQPALEDGEHSKIMIPLALQGITDEGNIGIYSSSRHKGSIVGLHFPPHE